MELGAKLIDFRYYANELCGKVRTYQAGKQKQGTTDVIFYSTLIEYVWNFFLQILKNKNANRINEAQQQNFDLVIF